MSANKYKRKYQKLRDSACGEDCTFQIFPYSIKILLKLPFATCHQVLAGVKNPPTGLLFTAALIATTLSMAAGMLLTFLTQKR